MKKKASILSLLLFASLFLFVSCSDDDDDHNDPSLRNELLPVKVVEKITGEVVTVEYDNLNRITKTRSENPNFGTWTECSISYNDKSPFYAPGLPYVIDSVKYTYDDEDVPSVYEINYSKVSSTQIRVDMLGRSKFSYLVDAVTGRLLKYDQSDRDTGEIYLTTEYEYNADGNVSKESQSYFDPELSSYNYVATFLYDDGKGIFSSIKTPIWFQVARFPVFYIFGYTNNEISMSIQSDCSSANKSTVEYNKQGYPINFKMVTEVSCDQSLNSTSEYQIEYQKAK